MSPPPIGLNSTLVTFPAGSLREHATVLHVLPDCRPTAERRLLVITDVTPFHPLDPLWPDQPADHGELFVHDQARPVYDTLTVALRGNGPLMVDEAINARRDEPEVVFMVAHVVDATAAADLAAGAQVTLVVDKDRRGRLSAAHTACHLLAYALNEATHDLWNKPTHTDSRGHHDFDEITCVDTCHDINGSIDKYRIGKSLRKRGFDTHSFLGELSRIIAEVNLTLMKWIESNAAVSINCAGPRLTDRRLWICETPNGKAQMPCGGTHVRRLGEIKSMTAAASIDSQSGILTIRNEVRLEN